MTESVPPATASTPAAGPTSLYGYEIVQTIGEGAGSVVYAVSDQQTKQLYALKQVAVKTDKQARFAEQLINEYDVAKNINSPLVRRVFDLKVTRTLLRKVTEAAMVMELVDGTPLDQCPPKNFNETIDIFVQVATALGSVHFAGFIDCDLKPNNILVCADGSIKLIDLGQACPPLTVKQRIQGTPDYISPEQVKCEPVTVRTDVYNFGATLYWALCGKPLPTLFTLKKSENSILYEQGIPSPQELNPAVPLPLSNLTMECVRINPAKRPGDMNEISRRLELMKLGFARANGGSKAGVKVVSQ